MRKPDKIRAIADNDEVGQQRYRTYKAAISRINLAIENGYFLEAITLCESIIADRLESRLNFLAKSEKFSFEMLSNLQKGIDVLDSGSELNKIIIERLDRWRKNRNNALHGMAKIADGDKAEWDDKMIACKEIAIEGELLRKEVFRLTNSRKK